MEFPIYAVRWSAAAIGAAVASAHLSLNSLGTICAGCEAVSRSLVEQITYSSENIDGGETRDKQKQGRRGREKSPTARRAVQPVWYVVCAAAWAA